VIHHYQAKGMEGLRDHRYANPGRQRLVPQSGKPSSWRRWSRTPHQLGVNRATWTAPLLAEYLARETGIRVGEVLRYYADHRDSATFCSLAARCVARSQSRGRRGPLTKSPNFVGTPGRAILLVDNLRIHTPEGARKVQDLVAHYGGEWMELVYLPKYSPDLQPQEKLWRVWRARVTHNHQRTTLEELEADSEACFAEWDADPMAVFRIIGSPFAIIEPKETLYALVI